MPYPQSVHALTRQLEIVFVGPLPIGAHGCDQILEHHQRYSVRNRSQLTMSR